MTIVTTEKLENADKDCNTLGEVISSDENTDITSRLGRVYPSMAKALYQVIQTGGFEPFQTEAALLSSVPTVPKKAAKALDTKKIWYWGGSSWTDTGLSELDQAKSYTDTKVFTTTGKNMFDRSKTIPGEYFSVGSNKILSSSLWRRSNFIPIVAGEIYTLSGNLPASVNIAWYTAADKTLTPISYTSSKVGQVAPAGAKFAVFNITNTGQDDQTYDATAQFEKGTVATSYEPFKALISGDQVTGVPESVKDYELYDYTSKNMVDPSKVNFVKRVSGTGFVNDTVGAAASDWIPVKEGQWYTISGPGLFLNTSGAALGAYFTSYGQATGVQTVSFVNPVDGNGKSFKVPTGMGITYVAINLKKLGGSSGSTTLDGEVQLELGEISSPYQPYELKPYVKESLLPETNGGGGGSSAILDNAAWYKYTSADGARIYQDKLPRFRKAVLLKNEDVIVVNAGTSLTARTSEHCTLREDAKIRPPMMHANSFCSYIWDALNWTGQEYRRYDSGHFTETGSFATSSSLSEWDDGPYRDGLTRYSSTANASVQFQIPIGAWQFNFIYRTDSLGCDATITVAGGNGLVQVFNETSKNWVEANGLTFSQLETTPIARPIGVPSPITGAMTTYTIASKGNTTYQKRLKMRCKDNASLDSLSSVKNISISRTGGGPRLMYWGVEWSPRQFMITYINAARGSHKTDAASAQGLPRFADNEIWGFKPTLFLSELAIHNDGASGITSYQVGRWAGLAKNYVLNLDFELSMYSRAAYFGADPEYVFFTASTPLLADENTNGISADGKSLRASIQTASANGPDKAMTTLDKYEEAEEALKSNNIICLNAAKRWIEAGLGIYGNMRIAYAGSMAGGASMSSDGTHWNDNGSKVMAKAVLPVL